MQFREINSGNKIVIDTYPSDYSSRTSYISLDGGDSFQMIDLISKINNYQQPYLANGVLFITGFPLSVVYSNDNGNSFSSIPLNSIPNPNLNQLFIFVILLKNSSIYLNVHIFNYLQGVLCIKF